MIEQLSLLSAGLAPLKLNDRVRVIAENWEGVIAQIWPGRDWYAVYAHGRGSLSALMPTYRRDELELLENDR